MSPVAQLVDVALEHATSFFECGSRGCGCREGCRDGCRWRPYAFVPLADFRVDAVNGEGFDAREDYRAWRRPDLFRFILRFSLCLARWPRLGYCSWNRRCYRHVFEHYALSPFDRADVTGAVSDLACPYLKLDVRRDCLLADTMR